VSFKPPNLYEIHTAAHSYLVFDRKLLNPNNSNGFARFSCAEELPAEGADEARRTEIQG
jgi:hypothetical protein